MPRHSPYALYSLNFITLFSINCFSLSIAWVSFDNFSSWIVTLDLWKGFILRIIFEYPPCTHTSLYFPWRIVVIHDSWKDRSFIVDISIFLKTVFLNYLFVLLFCALFGFQWTFAFAARCAAGGLNVATSPLELALGPLPHCSLCFIPHLSIVELVGSSGLEPPTSRLSGARSNHLSYEPIQFL